MRTKFLLSACSPLFLIHRYFLLLTRLYQWAVFWMHPICSNVSHMNTIQLPHFTHQFRKSFQIKFMLFTFQTESTTWLVSVFLFVSSSVRTFISFFSCVFNLTSFAPLAHCTLRTCMCDVCASNYFVVALLQAKSKIETHSSESNIYLMWIILSVFIYAFRLYLKIHLIR